MSAYSNLPSLRPAAVAGRFYPGDAEKLRACLRELLDAGQERASPLPLPKAVVAPHAGYVYSGPTAARVYAPLQALRGRISRVALFGPAHRVAIEGLALPESAGFATPLGVVPVDLESVERLAALPHVGVSDAAHAQEHALEVQLPFLQTVLGDFSLVPLVVGNASPEAVAEVLDLLWGGRETLIVVSSDLSHYRPYDLARQIDAQTARRILALDPSIRSFEACGAAPINGLLLIARRRGLKARLIDLCNSGDTAGDRARVVGYAGLAFYEEMGDGD